MNIDTAYQSKRLRPTDMGDAGEITLTIRAVEMEELKGNNGKEWKPVLHFHQIAKTLPLNVTNKNSIKQLYGPETTNWIGKPVTFITMPVQDFGGNVTEGIRVKLKGLQPQAGMPMEVLGQIRQQNAMAQPHPPVNVRDLPPQPPELPVQKSIAEQLADAKGQAMRVWWQLQESLPDDNARKAALVKHLQDRFKLTPGQQLGIEQWKTLARTGFMELNPGDSPISEQTQIPPDDIPF